jgi:hypothetical protein
MDDRVLYEFDSSNDKITIVATRNKNEGTYR